MRPPSKAVAFKVLTAALLLAFFIGWWVVTPDTGYLCSCPQPGSPTDAMAESSAVFSARVLDIADVSARKGPLISSADPLKVTFQVETVWKGPVRETLEATTARFGASCGFRFEEGYQYLVYARGDESDLKVSLCSRTRPIIFALEDVEELGEGNTVATDSKREPGRFFFVCGAPIHPTGAGADLSLAATLVGLMGLRFRRRWTDS